MASNRQTAGRERTAGGRRWMQSDGGQTKGGRRPDTSKKCFLQKKSLWVRTGADRTLKTVLWTQKTVRSDARPRGKNQKGSRPKKRFSGHFGIYTHTILYLLILFPNVKSICSSLTVARLASHKPAVSQAGYVQQLRAAGICQQIFHLTPLIAPLKTLDSGT